MTITRFRSFTDGLASKDRVREQFMIYTDFENPKMWVPYGDGVWFQPCLFKVSNGGFSNVLKVLPGKRLNPHYHISGVRGFTLQGQWRYLEHDWIAHPGSFIYEPAGEAHTLVVPESSPEPMISFFDLDGGLIYLDTIDNGQVVGYDDGFTLLDLARRHYETVGFDPKLLDRMIR
jgi:hypothetical protein